MVITKSIQLIDTHTGGEPTRVVVDSSIDLGPGRLSQKRRVFQQHFDHIRRAIVCEPRGSEAMVGALLTEPDDSASIAGVIFFNNVGYLGMCGHGTMGVAVALQHLGRLSLGAFQIDTPVGPVVFELSEDNRVSLQNVPSYRHRAAVELCLPDGGTVHGDVAWGGNWFFISDDHGCQLDLANLGRLGQFTAQMQESLARQGDTGADGQVIDHVELIGPPSDPAKAHARNYVRCPGGAYDRSPCGTGTSAKLACLAADGRLAAGEIYLQESIIGSVFEASYRPLANGCIQPTIAGQPFVNGEYHVIIDDRDPFALGLA